ncbi:hypothetical protein D9X91_17030 [Falsibacillus albus]|uniref:Uncharacterized protein n=1 Tax=Falsibacillus albus TaxID=2478915 RepID=A0A3L7JTU2_9BACI|nr:hypothetical protein D9X91_17030 [Falsibacillus albus]
MIKAPEGQDQLPSGAFFVWGWKGGVAQFGCHGSGLMPKFRGIIPNWAPKSCIGAQFRWERFKLVTKVV